MRKKIHIELLGNKYRSVQFPASTGIMMVCSNEINPVDILQGAEVLTTYGWKSLEETENVNAFVFDINSMVPPVSVLNELCSKIYIENFGFLSGWKPVKIPPRLVSGKNVDYEQAKMDPVISMIVMSGKATMKELEEYYSSEDAFKMYDMIAVDNLNKALCAEAAIIESKQKTNR